MITLDSKELAKMKKLILENLRISKGKPPVYIDLHDNLTTILAKQNHVIYGRRGSGKSALISTAKENAAAEGFICAYIDSELTKSNPYPDIVISILMNIFSCLSKELMKKSDRGLIGKLKFWRSLDNSQLKEVNTLLQNLKKLKNEPEAYDVKLKTTSTEDNRSGAAVKLAAANIGVDGTISQANISTVEKDTNKPVIKIKYLQRNLETYQESLIRVLQTLDKPMMLFIDDYYHIPIQFQPDVIDYVHRLSKSAPLFIKLGTIRYRSSLYRPIGNIGTELHHDIFPIDLDYTLEDYSAMSSFLDQILYKFAEIVSIASHEIDNLFTEGGKKLLHLASGGVPRDYLSLFIMSCDEAKKLKIQKIEKQKAVGEAARHYLNDTKKPSMKEDGKDATKPLSKMLDYIYEFAIQEKGKTVFLISKIDGEKHILSYDCIKQLMDLRFIHMVDSDTSASYGSGGRYEGYLVDVGLWAAPRKPNLTEVDFEKKDSNGRKDELRNCPILEIDDATISL